MSPRRKTSAILTLAGGVIVAALLLHHGAPRARPGGGGGGSVSGLSARLESLYLLRGDREVHMAITVEGPEAERRFRPPLHLAIVIDRSDSMNENGDDKLAKAREAAVQLVSQLHEGDRFSVLSYGDDVTVVVGDVSADARGKRDAIAAIERLRPYGNTNISAGLLAAADQLRGRPLPGAVTRIVLLSDGKANLGYYRSQLPGLAAEIAEQGVSISTVGMGLDFDERTMTSMAMSGRGNYYFVDGGSELAGIFTRELEHLSSTAATDVRVGFTPAPGVQVLDAYGYPMQQDGGRVVFPVADLRAGELRKIVLRMRVTANQLGAMDIGRVDSSFVHVASGRTDSREMLARAVVTEDARLVHDNLDREALRHIERARAARAIEEATSLYEQGQMQAARRVLEVQAEAISGIASQTGYGELEEINGAIGRAGASFAAAPDAPASPEGKRGTKGNRADAYDLNVK